MRYAPAIAREHCASRSIDLRRDVRAASATRSAQRPFRIGSYRYSPWYGGDVPQRQTRDLYRIGERHVLQQLKRDAVRLVLEATIAEAVASYVGSVVANR